MTPTSLQPIPYTHEGDTLIPTRPEKTCPETQLIIMGESRVVKILDLNAVKFRADGEVAESAELNAQRGHPVIRILPSVQANDIADLVGSYRAIEVQARFREQQPVAIDSIDRHARC